VGIEGSESTLPGGDSADSPAIPAGTLKSTGHSIQAVLFQNSVMVTSRVSVANKPVEQINSKGWQSKNAKRGYRPQYSRVCHKKAILKSLAANQRCIPSCSGCK
jgi:hypothetical protein